MAKVQCDIMKTKIFLFIITWLLVLGYVLIQIPFLESSNGLAQPLLSHIIPIQSKNQTTRLNTNVSPAGNASAKTSSMLPYVNPLNGISMLYPPDWQSSVSGLSYPQLIRFYSPLQNLSDFIPAQVTIGVTKYVNNGITLRQYTNFVLTILNESQKAKQLIIDNSNPVMVAGDPGYRVTFSTSPSSNSTSGLRTMETWTVVDNKLYTITYLAEPSKFVTYLPKVTLMLDSLRINRSNTAADTTPTATHPNNITSGQLQSQILQSLQQ